MFFGPQRRALFEQPNFQKCSEAEMFLICWLRNLLRATAARTFSTSQLPKAVWGWGALDIWLRHVLRTTAVYTFEHLNFQKCSDNDMFLVFWLGNFASGHNGVHFLNISTSKLSPRMRRFEHFDFQMCFAPQRRARFDLSSHHMVPRPPL
jgi:hypothetical protein